MSPPLGRRGRTGIRSHRNPGLSSSHKRAGLIFISPELYSSRRYTAPKDVLLSPLPVRFHVLQVLVEGRGERVPATAVAFGHEKQVPVLFRI